MAALSRGLGLTVLAGLAGWVVLTEQEYGGFSRRPAVSTPSLDAKTAPGGTKGASEFALQVAAIDIVRPAPPGSPGSAGVADISATPPMRAVSHALPPMAPSEIVTIVPGPAKTLFAAADIAIQKPVATAPASVGMPAAAQVAFQVPLSQPFGVIGDVPPALRATPQVVASAAPVPIASATPPRFRAPTPAAMQASSETSAGTTGSIGVESRASEPMPVIPMPVIPIEVVPMPSERSIAALDKGLVEQNAAEGTDVAEVKPASEPSPAAAPPASGKFAGISSAIDALEASVTAASDKTDVRPAQKEAAPTLASEPPVDRSEFTASLQPKVEVRPTPRPSAKAPKRAVRAPVSLEDVAVKLRAKTVKPSSKRPAFDVATAADASATACQQPAAGNRKQRAKARCVTLREEVAGDFPSAPQPAAGGTLTTLNTDPGVEMAGALGGDGAGSAAAGLGSIGKGAVSSVSGAVGSVSGTAGGFGGAAGGAAAGAGGGLGGLGGGLGGLGK